MKLFVCALASLFAMSAHAFENRFSVNNNSEMTWTDLRVGQYSSSFDRYSSQSGDNFTRRADSIRAQRLELGVNQALSESLSFNGGFMFQSKEFRNETSMGDRSVVELGWLQGSLKQALFYEELTLNIGIDGRVAVGTQQNDYLDGQHVMTPWIGTESYIGQYAVGGRLYTAVYMQSTGAEDYARRDPSLGLMGFVDVPLFPKVNVGFAMGVARTNAQLHSSLSNAVGTELLSEIRGGYRFDSKTIVNGVIESRNDSALDATSTQFSVGLTRAM